MPGPLTGLKVIEFAGIGPGPFAAMLFADMGAEVVRVERRAVSRRPLSLLNAGPFDVLNRGRRAVAIDLKRPGGVDVALRLVAGADALIEGFRPGVMERLGLSPDVCLARNPRLVYGRMTGWGQTGPLAHAAGHDINYIALSGALHAIGTPEQPLPPLNLVGDFGGGALLLAWGMLAALWEARTSGQGQVVDAAMTDGAALLMAMIYGVKAGGLWTNTRGANLLDGGAPFYTTYACADGKFLALGPIEPQFYRLFLAQAGILDPDQAGQPAPNQPAPDQPTPDQPGPDQPASSQPGPDLADQYDLSAWPAQRAKLAAIFRTRTRDEWCALLAGSDACVTPVLDLDEAPRHPHNLARETFVVIDDVLQPAPAPRLSRTPAEIRNPPPSAGQDTEAVLADWGFTREEIATLIAGGSIGVTPAPTGE